MNNKSGSFFICPRLQQRFVTFSVPNPSDSQLNTTFHSILNTHLYNFHNDVSVMCKNLTEASIAVHREISVKFPPSGKHSLSLSLFIMLLYFFLILLQMKQSFIHFLLLKVFLSIHDSIRTQFAFPLTLAHSLSLPHTRSLSTPLFFSISRLEVPL